VNFPGAVLYRKDSAVERSAGVQVPWLPEPVAAFELPAVPPEPPVEVTEPPPQPAAAPPAEYAVLAREYANQGNLTEALLWTARWIDSNKVEPAAHYLHAMILQEKGERSDARRALQSAVFLQPDFALAHFALGNLARAEGHAAEADRHFANALRSLRNRSPDEPLPDSGGMTVGGLVQTINALAGGKVR
jgi:chemotaxis protein methyltransferase CheR